MSKFNFVYEDDGYLEHHGVLGMKWGIRKDGKPQGWSQRRKAKSVTKQKKAKSKPTKKPLSERAVEGLAKKAISYEAKTKGERLKTRALQTLGSEVAVNSGIALLVGAGKIPAARVLRGIGNWVIVYNVAMGIAEQTRED